MNNADYIGLLQLIVLFVGLAFAGWQLYQLQHRDIFDYLSEYTRRYSEILVKLPLESADHVSIDEITEEERRVVLAYLDLCGEEEFMSRKKYIPSSVWKEWEEGIQATTKLKLFQTGIDFWRDKGWIGSEVYSFLKGPHN